MTASSFALPWALCLLAPLALPVHAAPHTPKDDAAVLERLPAKRDAPEMRELRKLRAAHAAAPEDADAAAALAKRYFELANADGDPRYIGYAQAVLRRWPSDAPAEVLYVRGLLRQYRHDFQGALTDLARALDKDPQHFGARAWRAAIYMVRAEYAAASSECAALPGAAGELYAAGCRAYVEATTGNARMAYGRLSEALRRDATAAPETRLWVLTRLAEMAWRLEEHAAAERWFRQALALGVEDNFLRAAYADFLLERERPKEVVALLKPFAHSDTLLLRLALAEKRLALREADARAKTLADRFAAAALRGERLHLGEEARYLLELKGDAGAALETALENWQDQREPRDALIVLEAAAAARQPAAAAPVLKWLEESRFESERLRRIAASLR
jgi:hypothetical protein